MLTIHVCVRDGIFLADDVYRDERWEREKGGRRKAAQAVGLGRQVASPARWYESSSGEAEYLCLPITEFYITFQPMIVRFSCVSTNHRSLHIRADQWERQQKSLERSSCFWCSEVWVGPGKSTAGPLLERSYRLLSEVLSSVMTLISISDFCVACDHLRVLWSRFEARLVSELWL